MGISRKIGIGVLFLFMFAWTGQLWSQNQNKQYKVALILPFKTSGYHGSVGEAMLDYYEGFKVAIKGLESDGLKMQLYVFDSEKDSLSMDDIFAHPDLAKMDIIVGPVYENQLNQMLDFCTKNKILLVSPLKYFPVKSANSKVINFFTPDSTRLASAVIESSNYFPAHRFYIVRDLTPQSIKNAAIMRRACAKQGISNYKSVLFSGGKFTPAITRTDSVILLCAIPSEGIKPSLESAVKTKRNSFLIGYHDWYVNMESFYNINEKKTLYPVVNFINSADSAADYFEKKFLDEYAGEPSKYAYIGFDQATYISYGLMAFGKDFYKHLPNAGYRGFINVIHLENGPNCIYNTGMNLVQIIDGESKDFEP
jgi:hypothetical protein